MALLVVMVAIVPENAFAAAHEARYELRSGDLTFGNDHIDTGLGETVFHQQTLALTDVEHYGLAFPATTDGIDLGSSIGPLAADGIDLGPGATSNVLPFGLVDLAFPSITETSFQSYSNTSTGFFTAPLPFFPCCNYGAAPVGVGQFGVPSPVSPASFSGTGLMYPEMVVQGNLGDRGGSPIYTDTNHNNTRITLPMPDAPQATGIVAGIASGTVGGNSSDPLYNTSNKITNKSTLSDFFENGYAGNNAGTDNTTAGTATGASNTSVSGSGGNITAPLLLSSHRFNMDAPSDQINDTSMVERMWRNAHVGRLMNIAYEGDASYPTWIAPESSPKDLLQWRDLRKVIGYSSNMTRPGEYITHAFWDM